MLNTYKFTLGWRHSDLELMDVVTLTHRSTRLTLDKLPVRITAIEEDDNGDLAITAEEYIQGLGSAESYPTQTVNGGTTAVGAPGNVNPPLIFEPPKKLVDAPQLWIALSGGPYWGGARMWVSMNGGDSYYDVAMVYKGARTGVLSAELAGHADPDSANTLAVDLTECRGSLASVSQADCDLFASLCYVDGELIGYRDAALTSQYHYNLSYLRRGTNGSTIGAHASGTRFARLDDCVARWGYNVNNIGTQIHFKFTSFDIKRGQEQDLADVAAYTYTPSGVSVPDGYNYNPDWSPPYYSEGGGA